MYVADPGVLPSLKETSSWIFRGQRSVGVLIGFIVLSDLMFIALHIWSWARGSENSLLYIDVDRGYAEFFQYLKILYIVFLILVLAVETRSWKLAAWILPFTYLLGDDSYQIHEKGGAYIAEALKLQSMWGLRPADFGEATVSLLVALVSLMILIPAYLRADSTERWVFQRLLLLIMVLAFFGVFIDLVHVAAMSVLQGFDWIAVLEDGGEMLTITFIIAFLIRLTVGNGKPVLHSGTKQFEN